MSTQQVSANLNLAPIATFSTKTPTLVSARQPPTSLAGLAIPVRILIATNAPYQSAPAV